jgi:energy-coupling factor transporter ATP-binding protein EcfA2
MATELRIEEDVPAADPQFDFDLIGAVLAEVLEQPTSGAIVVGIHGPWGSGKTTLMKAIRGALPTGQEERPIVIEFNAWKYQAREALWRALILSMIGAIRDEAAEGQRDELNELESSLYAAFEVQESGPWSINWRTAATEVASVALEVFQLGFAGRFVRSVFGRRKRKDGEPVLDTADVERISGVLERETVSRRVSQIQSIEQFLGVFTKLATSVRGSRRIIVLIDDLDRCLPESALEVFEAIKLFLDAPGCGFVVAIDREVIRSGLAVRYAPLIDKTSSSPVASADEYIEKTIGISYDVPRLSPTDVTTMIDDAEPPFALSGDQKKAIGEALDRNPRRVKRFVSLLKVQVAIARRLAERGTPPAPLIGKGDESELSLLLKTLLIGYRYPVLVRRGDSNPVFEFQRAVSLYQRDSDEKPDAAARGLENAFSKMPVEVAALRGERGLWSLLAWGPPLDGEESKGQAIEYLDWFRRTGFDPGAEPNPDTDLPSPGAPQDRR